MKQLVLVRHGITDFNQGGILQGQVDTPLNDLGVTQAQCVSSALSKVPFELAFCSPLQRAQKTAELILSERPIGLETLELLRERSFGQYEGKARELFFQELEQAGSPAWEYRPLDGESILDVFERAKKLVEQLKLLKGSTLLLVGHSVINRCVILNLLNLGVHNWDRIDQANCCINTFNFDAQGHLVNSDINRVSHLSVEI